MVVSNETAETVSGKKPTVILAIPSRIIVNQPMKHSYKNQVSPQELARQERARKFRQSVLYRSVLHNLRTAVWLYNVASMHRLIESGLDNFDAMGQIFVRNHISLQPEQMSGDVFLTEIIEYFLLEDAPYAYRFCAQAKELLDTYKMKFGC